MKVTVRIDTSAASRLQVIATWFEQSPSSEYLLNTTHQEVADFLTDLAGIITAAANDPDADEAPLPDPPEDEDFPVTDDTACPPWHYLPGPYGDDIGRQACPHSDTHDDQRERYEQANIQQ